MSARRDSGRKGQDKTSAGQGKYRIVNMDFVVAAVVLIILEAVLLTNFLIIPFKKSADVTSKELIAARTRLEEVALSSENAAEKERMLSELEQKISDSEKVLPPNILNEEISLTINEYAQKHNIALEAVVFAPRVAVTPDAYLTQKLPLSSSGVAGVYDDGELAPMAATGAANAGATGATGAMGAIGAAEAAGTAGVAGSTGAVGNGGNKNLIIQDVQVSFSSEFHTAGAFIKEFEDSLQKIKVNNVSLTRIKEGVLRGVISLEYAALTDNAEAAGSERFTAPAVEGKESLFLKYKGYVEEDSDPTVILQQGDVDVEPNFYMVVNSSVDNDTKIRFGVYPRPETEIYFNVNNAVKAKLTISGDENELSYTYTMGTASRTERRRLDITDGTILLNVISRPRANDDDKVAVLLDVENTTNLPLQIIVRNDDVLAPRFNLGATTGQVSVSQ